MEKIQITSGGGVNSHCTVKLHHIQYVKPYQGNLQLSMSGIWYCNKNNFVPDPGCVTKSNDVGKIVQFIISHVARLSEIMT